MKQKKAISITPIEERLFEILKDLPTKKDVEIIVKKQLKNYPTKKNLHDEIRYAELRTELKIDEAKRELDEKAQKYRDQILNREDKTIGELEDIRMENDFQNREISMLKDQSGDHEKRISALETSAKHPKN